MSEVQYRFERPESRKIIGGELKNEWLIAISN